MLNKSSFIRHVVAMVCLFFLSFAYMHFFTQCVPFFFDDHEFHRDYVQQEYEEQFLELVSFNTGRVSDGPRPVYGIFFKTMFGFLGFDYCGFRIAKTIIFSLFVIAVYGVAFMLFKRRFVALVCAMVIMTLFPTFLQTFGYNGPHIIAEFFKLLVIVFLLRDIRQNNTSFINQITMFFLSLLAIRTYAPAYSLAGTLPLFVVIYDWRKFARYIPLFILILIIQFPVTFNFSTSGSAYTPKLVNLEHVFLNDVLPNVANPFPTYENLYYKSFTDVLTFFGFWLLVACGSWLFITKIFCSRTRNSVDSRMIFCLTISWIASELPTYIFLPEHAIRYIFTFSTPFVLLAALVVMYFIIALPLRYRKSVTVFVLIMIGGIIFTNISYVYAFRMGWGSSFIGFDKVMDFFAEKGNHTGVLYYAGSVASEYFPVNKSSTKYKFRNDIAYLKTASNDDFSEANLNVLAQSYDDFYVLKRTTSLSKTQYPGIAFEQHPFLKEIAVIQGTNESILFDRLNARLVKIFNIPYKPNAIVIYRYTKI